MHDTEIFSGIGMLKTIEQELDLTKLLQK